MRVGLVEICSLGLKLSSEGKLNLLGQSHFRELHFIKSVMSGHGLAA
jgi:hypothetical protein